MQLLQCTRFLEVVLTELLQLSYTIIASSRELAKTGCEPCFKIVHELLSSTVGASIQDVLL